MVRTVLFLFMLAGGRWSFAQPQNPSPAAQDVFASIPDDQRQGFQSALASIVSLEQSGDWGQVYDRFYLNDKGLTRERFVYMRHRLHVVAFAPIQIYYSSPTQRWMVIGCAEFKPPLPLLGKRSGGVVTDFGARYGPDGWRFDAPPAITVYKDPPSGLRSCAVSK